MRLVPGIWAGALLALCTCGEELPRSTEQVEAAVEAYLAERTDLKVSHMEVRADRIRYDGDRAVASVSIMASDDPKAAMKMVYELVQVPDGWRVVPSQASAPSTGSGPGGPGATPGLPPGHPPTSPGGLELPQGHPPTAPEGGLPPGHPPISGETL